MMDKEEVGLIFMLAIIVLVSIALGYYVVGYRYDLCMNNTYYTWWQCIVLSIVR